MEENAITQPEENGARTFTQEEVNKIVSERLARERSKSEPTPEETKLQELAARESRLACREYIAENDYKKELLDIFDTSDMEKFKNSVEKLKEAFPDIFTAMPMRTGMSHQGGSDGMSEDRLAEAFRP